MVTQVTVQRDVQQSLRYHPVRLKQKPPAPTHPLKRHMNASQTKGESFLASKSSHFPFPFSLNEIQSRTMSMKHKKWKQTYRLLLSPVCFSPIYFWSCSTLLPLPASLSLTDLCWDSPNFFFFFCHFSSRAWLLLTSFHSVITLKCDDRSEHRKSV